jgi:hypothetical protein
MTISRRKFIKAGIIVAACAGLPLKDQFAKAQEVGGQRLKTPAVTKALPRDQTDILDYYNRSTFAAYVNTEFSVRVSASKVRRIKLVEVRDYAGASNRAAASEDCFSLFFTAPSSRFFPQDTYEVEHAALGKFMLFIVPTDMRSKGEQHFEAAFNRCNQ